jgi:hypothetical protein
MHHTTLLLLFGTDRTKGTAMSHPVTTKSSKLTLVAPATKTTSAKGVATKDAGRVHVGGSMMRYKDAGRVHVGGSMMRF